MALRDTLGDCPGRGDEHGMSTGAIDRVEVTREPSGRLGNTPEEQYVARAAQAMASTASATVTLGLAKGWKFRCRAGDEVALWLPGSGTTAVTYTLRYAALWRAIKTRGVSLT